MGQWHHGRRLGRRGLYPGNSLAQPRRSPRQRRTGRLSCTCATPTPNHDNGTTGRVLGFISGVKANSEAVYRPSEVG
jgi:hypothetical protein